MVCLLLLIVADVAHFVNLKRFKKSYLFSGISCCFNVVVFSVVLVALFVSVFGITYWGISESEMKMPSIEYLELSKAPFKPVVGQNVSLHAFPAARNTAFLILVFLVCSTFGQSFSDIK